MITKKTILRLVKATKSEKFFLTRLDRIATRLRNLHGFIQNGGHKKGYFPDFGKLEISDVALEVAKEIRGIHNPAIILYGVMSRSGTGYVGGTKTLLGLHPDILCHPNKLWEVPFLENSYLLKEFQEIFFKSYGFNIGKIGANDFLPLFGSAFINYLLYSLDNDYHKYISITRPSVEFLNYFFDIFPYENLLLLMRDGRDVVNSHFNTFSASFPDICVQWNDSAQMMLSFVRHYQEKKGERFLYVKFEDVVADPAGFIKRFCKHFHIDCSMYPFEKIASIPVVGSSTMKHNDKVTWKPIKKPEGFNPVGRWTKWSNKKKRIFKKLAGQTLIEAGYCKDLKW